MMLMKKDANDYDDDDDDDCEIMSGVIQNIK